MSDTTNGMLDALYRGARDLSLPKATRESYIRQARIIERELNLPNHNLVK